MDLHQDVKANIPAKDLEKKPLRLNPFTAYRDQKTGAWVVIKSVAA